MKMTRPNDNPDFNKLINRVSRIEGQFKGIRRMIEQGDQCLDIITQITAIKSAISMVGVEVLKKELLRCQKSEKKINDSYIKKLFEISN